MGSVQEMIMSCLYVVYVVCRHIYVAIMKAKVVHSSVPDSVWSTLEQFVLDTSKRGVSLKWFCSNINIM